MGLTWAAPPPHLSLTGTCLACRHPLAEDGTMARLCFEAAEDNTPSLCTRHGDGDRASIRVWCRHHVSGPAQRHHVRTRGQRMTTPGPTRRKKVGTSALRERLSLDNGGPHKGSVRVG